MTIYTTGHSTRRGSGREMTVYTIGHSTRSAEELLALLRERDVKLLADVRRFPSSRRHSQFNREAAAEWLGRSGIEYRHMAGLAGRRVPDPDSRNGAWRESAFRGYADYMGSAEFLGALAELEEAARKRSTAIMCAEAVWWRCHRRLIADALIVRGWRVEHLGIGVAPALHELPEFAVVGTGGSITYPPPQTRLI